MRKNGEQLIAYPFLGSISQKGYLGHIFPGAFSNFHVIFLVEKANKEHLKYKLNFIYV